MSAFIIPGLQTAAGIGFSIAGERKRKKQEQRQKSDFDREQNRIQNRLNLTRQAARPGLLREASGQESPSEALARTRIEDLARQRLGQGQTAAQREQRGSFLRTGQDLTNPAAQAASRRLQEAGIQGQRELEIELAGQLQQRLAARRSAAQQNLINLDIGTIGQRQFFQEAPAGAGLEEAGSELIGRGLAGFERSANPLQLGGTQSGGGGFSQAVPTTPSGTGHLTPGPRPVTTQSIQSIRQSPKYISYISRFRT